MFNVRKLLTLKVKISNWMDIMKGAIVYLLNDSEEDKNDFKSSLNKLTKFLFSFKIILTVSNF